MVFELIYATFASFFHGVQYWTFGLEKPLAFKITQSLQSNPIQSNLQNGLLIRLSRLAVNFEWQFWKFELET